MSFIDDSIADRERRLAAINNQVEQLRRDAALLEGELRAFRAVKANDARGKTVTSAKPVHRPIPVGAIEAANKVSFSRLSPVWQIVFQRMVAEYPRKFSDAEIRRIAVESGKTPGESFRTSLWHHMKRGALDRDTDGNYSANRTTAQKAGIRWPH
jgi:hypothetical protein